MAEFQWWLLLVGLVAGGALVAVISMDSARREVDVTAREREAEAGLLAAQLDAEGQPIDAATVAAVLRAHADYLKLPPPDRLETVESTGADRSVDGNPDRPPHDVGDDGGRNPDHDLPPA